MIEIHHVLIAVIIGLLFGLILGMLFKSILTEKDAKQWWNNPRNNDDFLNIPPQTNHKKRNLN